MMKEFDVELVNIHTITGSPMSVLMRRLRAVDYTEAGIKARRTMARVEDWKVLDVKLSAE